MDGKNTKLSYPLEKYDKDVARRSFHNVQRMREKAASRTNVRMEQGMVTSLVEHKRTVTGVQYKTKNGEELSASAPLTIVCDGCFSNLRRALCNPKGLGGLLQSPIRGAEKHGLPGILSGISLGGTGLEPAALSSRSMGKLH